MLSANKWLYFFLSNLYPFTSFSCLIAQSSISSIILNRSGKKYILESLLVSFSIVHIILLLDRIDFSLEIRLESDDLLCTLFSELVKCLNTRARMPGFKS